MRQIIRIAVATMLAGTVLEAVAGSDQNLYVKVTCDAPGIVVRTAGDPDPDPNGANPDTDFNIFAPGQRSQARFNVVVEPVGDWRFDHPTPPATPTRAAFEMRGGGVSGYAVKNENEEDAGGTIFFHNYLILSDYRKGGNAKKIVVPAGTKVTYTARKNGEDCPSKWTISGHGEEMTKIGPEKITINRAWWDVAEWYIDTFDTPKAGVYTIEANDLDFPDDLKDEGEMKVVGVKRIYDAGPKGKESDHIKPFSPGEPWKETEVIYAEPLAEFNMKMELEPHITTEELESIQDALGWVSGAGSATPVEGSNKLEAECVAAGSKRAYNIAAVCGKSKRFILVDVSGPKIHKVTFKGDIGILKDTTGIKYDGPAWQDNDLDGVSDLPQPGTNADLSKPYQPVAYLSTKRMAAEAEFLIDGFWVSNPAKRIEEYDVLAGERRLRFAPVGMGWSAPVEFGQKDFKMGSTAKTEVVASTPFRAVPEVGYEDSHELLWEVGFGVANTPVSGLTWKPSNSKHELYLTYKAEVESFETVFHLSCENANGMKTDPTVVEGIWKGFSTGGAPADVTRKDGTPLTYYKSYLINVTWWEDLLRVTDGQCGSWASFFQETLRVHGISSDYILFYALPTAEKFLVKTWSFAGLGTSMDTDFPYKNDVYGDINNWLSYTKDTQYEWTNVVEVTYTSGTRGQNNHKPASFFGNHQIVYVSDTGVLYDPSYGLKHVSRQSIENTLSGYAKKFGNAYFFAKDHPNPAAGTNAKIYLNKLDFATSTLIPFPFP